MKKAYLYSKNQPEKMKCIGELFTLGSDPHLDWVDPTAAPRHFRIESSKDTYILRDLRSGQPTYLNGASVLLSSLKDQDEIQIGDNVFCFYLDEDSEASNIGLTSKNSRWNEKLIQLGNVAKTEYPVLLLGPSGSGKEIIAKAIHENSKRKLAPFISVNCSALTESLIESELFGHVKGAFTGAVSDRKGAFESARGGTLFLDEIGDLPYNLQAKLLRALENNEIRPVGSDRIINTDVRIITATHQNLIEKIQLQQFRSDLYFRINVVTVNTPSLIERLDDFEDLLYTFAKKFRVRFSFAAIQILKKHQWPGNIRELRNTVARASALYPKQEIDENKAKSLIDFIFCDPEEKNLLQQQIENKALPMIKEIERQMIIKKLSANFGNQKRTASELGIPKSTLHDRLKIYKIDPKIFAKKNYVTSNS